MGRDYVARNRRPQPRPAGLPGWIWLVAGLSIGLVVAAIVYIGRPAEPMPLSQSTATTRKSPPQPSVAIPPAEKPRFDFYTLLEKEQVVVPAQETPATPPKPALPPRDVPATAAAEPATPTTPTPEKPASAAPASPADTGRYLVVAGAFQDARNAEEHKARLAFAGLESQIEQVRGQDGKTWHRVRIGPAPLPQAQRQLGQLQANGFDGRVVRLP